MIIQLALQPFPNSHRTSSQINVVPLNAGVLTEQNILSCPKVLSHPNEDFTLQTSVCEEEGLGRAEHMGRTYRRVIRHNENKGDAKPAMCSARNSHTMRAH